MYPMRVANLNDHVIEEKINPLSSIHFIGLGGFGSNVVEHFYGKGINAHYTCIANPMRYEFSQNINYIPFEQTGHSASNYKLSPKQMVEYDENSLYPAIDQLHKIFDKNQHFMLFSGLGGYTGLRLTQVFTLWLYANNKSFHTICTTPFSFESRIRNTFATITLAKLSAIPNFHFIELDKFRVQYGSLALTQAFEKVNEEYYNVYKKLIN
jgi:cell division GTPase FtsZ